MEVVCPKCGGTAWLLNGDDEIYCPECELAKAELYEEVKRENEMY